MTYLTTCVTGYDLYRVYCDGCRFDVCVYCKSCSRRWEDNIKMDLQEVGRGCGDWMGLAPDRDRWRALVSTVMNFRVP